jgi:hypothetical protein
MRRYWRGFFREFIGHGHRSFAPNTPDRMYQVRSVKTWDFMTNSCLDAPNRLGRAGRPNVRFTRGMSALCHYRTSAQSPTTEVCKLKIRTRMPIQTSKPPVFCIWPAKAMDWRSKAACCDRHRLDALRGVAVNFDTKSHLIHRKA